MVLGAGYPQVRLLQAAKALGYATVVCSIKGDYPGFSHADETVYADISNPQEVLEAAEQYQADGIATCCLDTGLQALGFTCERLGLIGLREAAAVCCADKWSMKQAFSEHRVHTAKCYCIREEKELEGALCSLALPVLVKAVDLQGSKGVYICRTREEVWESYQQAMKMTRRDFCLIEEYIEGREFGAQAFIYRGEILFILPHGDHTYMSHTAVPVGHYVPFDLPEELIALTKMEVTKAIRAIGLDDCAVNIDLIEKDGMIYIIELTGRAGATCLPELVSIYYGVDYYKMIAMMAVGEDPRKLFEKRAGRQTANASKMLLAEQDGRVKRIHNPIQWDEKVCEISLYVKEGDFVRKFSSAKDRIGQVIVKGSDYEECCKKIEEIQSQIEIELE